MIREERKQISIFGDNWIYKMILEKLPDHPLVKLKPLVDKVLTNIEKDITVYYHSGFGRPAWPPGVILKMLLLEYLYNLSDVRVSQAVNCNILFKWFCGLDIIDAVPDDTTLVKFRKRLGEKGFKEIFEAFMVEAKRLGFGKGKLRILDATHVFSYSRGLSLLNLLKDGIRRIAKRAKAKTIALEGNTQQKISKITAIKGKAKIEEVKRLIKELVKELNGQRDKKLKRLLKIVTEVAKGAVASKQGKKRKISSLVDLDARWGYKSKDFPFFGYKVHLACDESSFVTNLEVLTGNKNEGNRLKGMIEKERRAEKIAGVPADAIYDSAKNREYLKKVGIRAYIPARNETSGIDKFEIEGERVRCRAGKYSNGKISQEHGILYYFSVNDCRGCKYYGRCVSPGEIRKKVYLSECKRLREEDYRAKVGIRSVIERINGWAKRWLGMGRARYCGVSKMLIQAILTFIAVDLKIMIRGPCLNEVNRVV